MRSGVPHNQSHTVLHVAAWLLLVVAGALAGNPIALVCATAIGAFSPQGRGYLRHALVLIPVVLTLALHFTWRLSG